MRTVIANKIDGMGNELSRRTYDDIMGRIFQPCGAFILVHRLWSCMIGIVAVHDVLRFVSLRAKDAVMVRFHAPGNRSRFTTAQEADT